MVCCGEDRAIQLQQEVVVSFSSLSSIIVVECWEKKNITKKTPLLSSQLQRSLLGARLFFFVLRLGGALPCA